MFAYITRAELASSCCADVDVSDHWNLPIGKFNRASEPHGVRTVRGYPIRHVYPRLLLLNSRIINSVTCPLAIEPFDR